MGFQVTEGWPSAAFVSAAPYPFQGGNHHGLERTASLAKSALYLAQNGSVPVLEVRDASQRHLAEVQKLVGKNNATPLTTILMYKPIKDLLADAKGDMGMIQKTLQDYGHMFRGSYVPTHNSIDHLTRAQFDKLFSKLRSGATEDDKVWLTRRSSLQAYHLFTWGEEVATRQVFTASLGGFALLLCCQTIRQHLYVQ